MDYTVGCECGRRHVVAATAAGSEMACECGRNVVVPPLSRLRASTGLGAYESGVLDTVQQMIRDGSLPAGDTCAVSGRPTLDVLLVVVQCERVYTPGDPSKLMVVFALINPLLTLLAMRRQEARPPVGRDTSVLVPLRVAEEFQRGLVRPWSRRKLRRLLREVPVYAQLLDAYPGATLRIANVVEELGALMDRL